jgi:hypothetical protein
MTSALPAVLTMPCPATRFNQAPLAAMLGAEEPSTQSIQNDIFIDEVEVFDQG